MLLIFKSQENCDASTKVYVGGISYYSSEDDIRSYFEGSKPGAGEKSVAGYKLSSGGNSVASSKPVSGEKSVASSKPSAGEKSAASETPDAGERETAKFRWTTKENEVVTSWVQQLKVQTYLKPYI
ncbi:hypothetical protein P8452_02957 [Trifolium repens]|nr:hypothetical protein P8452_02957 [Trifolium repens]